MLAFVKEQNNEQLKNRLFLVHTNDTFLKMSMAEHGNEPNKNVPKMQLLNGLQEKNEEDGNDDALMMFKHGNGNDDDNLQVISNCCL